MRSTEEQQLAHAFERKNKLIGQIKRDISQFDHLIASKLLIRGITPPLFLSTNPNGPHVPHLQPAISCSSSHFPLCNRNHQDIKGHHSELPNDSLVEFRASSVGLDAGEEQSVLRQRVTDHVVDAFDPVLEQDTSSVSPQQQKGAHNSGILQRNPDSLVKIQRSKSRQRALQLRSSAKTAKSCIRDGSNAITGAITGSGIALLQSDHPNVPELLKAVDNNSEGSSIEEQTDNCGSIEKNSSFSFGVVTRSKSSDRQSKSIKEVVCGRNSSDVSHEYDATLAQFGGSSLQTSNNLTQLVELPNHFSICDNKFGGEDSLSHDSKEKEISVPGRINESIRLNPGGVIESLKKENFSKEDGVIRSVQKPNHGSGIDELVEPGEPISERRDAMENLSFTSKTPDDVTPVGSSHCKTNSRKRSLQHQDGANVGASKENSSKMRSSRSKRSKMSGQQQSSLQETKTEGRSSYVANKDDAGLLGNVGVHLEPLKPPVSSENCSVEQARLRDQGTKDTEISVPYGMPRFESSILLPQSMDGSPNQYAGLLKSAVEEESRLSKEKDADYSSRIMMSNCSASRCSSVGTAGNLINDENYNNGTDRQPIGNSTQVSKAVNQCIEVLNPFPEFGDVMSNSSASQSSSVGTAGNLINEENDNNGSLPQPIGNSTQVSKAVEEYIEVLNPFAEFGESHRADEAKTGDSGSMEKENITSYKITRARSSRLSCDSVNKVLNNYSFSENGKDELLSEFIEEPENVGKLKEVMEEKLEGKVDHSCCKENCSSVLIGRMTRSRTSKQSTSAKKILKDDSEDKLLIDLKETVPRNSLEGLKNFGEFNELAAENMDWCRSKQHDNGVDSDGVSSSKTSSVLPTSAKENLNVGNAFVANDLTYFRLNGETTQAIYCLDKSKELFNHPISNKVTGIEALDDSEKENKIISPGISTTPGSSCLQPDHVSDIFKTVGFTNNVGQDVGSIPIVEPKDATEFDKLVGGSYNSMDMLIPEHKDGGTNPSSFSIIEDVEIGDYDGMPVFESFVMNADDQKHISGDGICLEKFDMHDCTLSSPSHREQICKSACLHPPLSHDSNTCKVLEAQSLCQPFPDQHISVDLSYIDKDIGTSYSDCLPCSSHEPSWDGKKPCTSPVKKVWDSILSFSGSSGKKISLSLDLPSIKEENESTDAIADIFQEESGSDFLRESSIREPLADIREVSAEVDMGVASNINVMDSLDANTDFPGTSKKQKLINQSGNGRGSSRLRANYNTSLGANAKQTSGLSIGRLGKAQVSGKTSLRGDRSYSEKGPKPNNIVSSVTSFIPLVQQKQATAVATGKRDVKVKALEAAEAAKRLAEKKENERKVRKEALKLERARQVKENLRQLELERKKKEEERKRKDSEMASRKRQRLEEEKGVKEKGMKRKHLEETQKQLRGHEGKFSGEKGNKVSKNNVDGTVRLRNDFKNGAGKLVRVEEEQGNRKGEYLPKIIPLTLGASDGDASRSNIDNHEEVISNAEVAMNKEHAVMNIVKEQSYEMSPYHPSDDEEDDDDVPNKKFIPSWASKSGLSMSIFSQQSLDPDAIFPSGSFCLIDKVCLNRKLQRM